MGINIRGLERSTQGASPLEQYPMLNFGDGSKATYYYDVFAGINIH